MTGTPGKIDPLELDALYGAVDDDGRQILYSLIVVGENADASLESWSLKRTTLLAEDLQNGLHGPDYQDMSYEAQQRSELNRARIREIGQSGNRQYSFNIVLLVYASNTQQLEDDIETMEGNVRGLDLIPHRVKGERQLARAVASGIGIDTM